MNRRALLIALAAALLGGACLFLYMRRFEAETSGGPKIKVLMAARDIPFGTALTREMLGVRQLPQAYVEQRHIRLQAACQLDRLHPVGRLADDLHVGLRVDHQPEPAAHQRLVVGDEHPDHGTTAGAINNAVVYSPDPDIGVVNALLSSAGGDPISWLGREDTANYAIILAYVWASTGFVMVVLSAALKGISQEVIEAARTDGATEWDIFRRIQFPLLSLPIAVVSVWMIINVIKIFDIVYIMTKGGPGGATRVIAYSYYVETFENGLGGYGASVAVVMLLLIIPVMIWQIRRFRAEAVVS